MNNILSLVVFFSFQIIPERMILNWYLPRLAIGSIAGILAGLLIGKFHLNRLEIKSDRGNANREARRWIIVYLILFLILLDFALFWDISSYSFGNYRFTNWKDIFISTYSLLVQIISLAALFLAMALAIRFIPNSSCKHAVIPV